MDSERTQQIKKKPESLSAYDPNRRKQEIGTRNEGEISEFARTAIIAVLLAIIIRSFLYEPFHIPSGSMLPTLKVGDYLFANKFAYGYSAHSFPFGLASFKGRYLAKHTPARGDMVVFKLPSDTSIDYIKRVIGLPGDTIQVLNGRLFINGHQVERKFIETESTTKGDETTQMTKYLETLPGGVTHFIYEESDYAPLDNTEVFTVPSGHYFMMGDNRDNSQDSRVEYAVGFVPLDNFVGRADLLFFSIDDTGTLYEPWTWPRAVRMNRLFRWIGPQ